jgi:protein-disulfide isomerase
MQCEDARSQITDYLGARSTSAGIAIEEHLRTCAECRREFEEFQALWSDLGKTNASSSPRLDARAALIAELKWRSNMRVVLKAVVILVVGASLAAGAGLFISRKTPERTAVAGHSRGPQDAIVTLVEYGDYECPPCFAREYHVIIDRLLEKYPQTVRYEFRHFPIEKIHPNALPAAMAAEAAGAQGRFWEMHKLLLASHETWYRNPQARDVFVDLAGKLGLNMREFMSALDSEVIKTRILQEQASGRDQGIQGTPTFLINGKKLDPVPTTFDAFDRLVANWGR